MFFSTMSGLRMWADHQMISNCHGGHQFDASLARYEVVSTPKISKPKKGAMLHRKAQQLADWPRDIPVTSSYIQLYHGFPMGFLWFPMGFLPNHHQITAQVCAQDALQDPDPATRALLLGFNSVEEYAQWIRNVPWMSGGPS